MLKRVADSGSPCLTPVCTSNLSANSLFILYYVLFLRVTVIFRVSQTIVLKLHMAAKALYLKSKVWCILAHAHITCEWWVRFGHYQWLWRQWLERSRRCWWCPVTDQFLLEWAERAKACTSGSYTPCVTFLYFFFFYIEAAASKRIVITDNNYGKKIYSGSYRPST